MPPQRSVEISANCRSVSNRSILRINTVASHISNDIGREVTLADLSLRVSAAKHGQNVPVLYGPRRDLPQELSRDLTWVLQKFQVGQDIFLMGPPGPFRRRLALWCCELLGREVEYVALSRDTTENDLKQRREILNGDLMWVDQAPVRAALNGRVLILDGIEKAERNVLPTLNNLLENREMQLQDGRFLCSPLRSDDDEGSKTGNLVRVSADFRVIALGLPVPAFPGYLLDPPLRSRFQARYVGTFTAEEHLRMLQRDFPTLNSTLAGVIVGCLVSIRELWVASLRGENSFKLCPCPEDLPKQVASLIQAYPGLQAELFSLIHRIYPASFLQYDPSSFKAVDHAFRAHGLRISLNELSELTTTSVPLLEVSHIGAIFHGISTPLHVPMGAFATMPDSNISKSAILPGNWNAILSAVIQDFSIGRDVAIVGAAGEGKTTFVRLLASVLRFGMHEIFTMQCFKDMTDRDLVQRRVTDSDGNTYWKDTPLLDAARHGGLLILDGINRLSISALSAIHGLIFDRDLWLPDGTHLVSEARFQQMNVAEHQGTHLRRISKNFRIIALGAPQSSLRSEQWISAELLPLFSWHRLPPLEENTKLQVMAQYSPGARESVLVTLIQLSKKMQESARGDASWRLSLRQLLRLARYASQHPDFLPSMARRTVMSTFWPATMRDAFEELLASNLHIETTSCADIERISVSASGSVLEVGDVRLPIATPEYPELVPQTLFFDNSRQLLQLREMARDLSLGSKHLLLIGNQGTGKNKLVDHLLQLLRWEREYIQLHRDTTVQSLTVQPTLEAGVIGWEDSPLVRAARFGRVLVCDEADKAPTEVVCVLKGLVEDGEMHLSDGRRLLRSTFPAKDSTGQSMDGVIPIHENFRLFVLANRPGFPFLGNDFFRECGDVFAVHVVENPDHDSKVEMLRKYAPSVPLDTLERLSAAFTELRKHVDNGTLVYPYSTRELVNIAKHLQVFPNTSMRDALSEVFDFEKHDYHARDVIVDILTKHGISLDGPSSPTEINLLGDRSLPIDHQTKDDSHLLGTMYRQALHEAMQYFKKLGSSRQFATSSLATNVQRVFSAIVVAELARGIQRMGKKISLADLVQQLSQQSDPRSPISHDDSLELLLRASLEGRSASEQLQEILRVVAQGRGPNEDRLSSRTEQTFHAALSRELFADHVGHFSDGQRLPLASEMPHVPTVDELLSVMPATEHELKNIIEFASRTTDEEHVMNERIVTSSMRLGALALQLSSWQSAASSAHQMSIDAQMQGNDGSNGSGEQGSDGEKGSGGDAGGGVGTGGSGSGARSGEGGAQGGDLQSDGRGGFSEEALLGMQESKDEVAFQANEVEEKMKEINQRIGTNDQLDQMRFGDPRSFGDYDKILHDVERPIAELRLIFDAAEAKEKEREWLNNQASGDLDDNKLIDGVTGEKMIYRRRGEPDKPAGLFQRLPKRLVFLVDVSASMARFNAQDGRLDRMTQTVAMVLEALRGRDHKFDYAVIGHSGNSPNVPFVNFGHPPQSRAERARIIQNMSSTASIAASGDTTLQATQLAIQAVAEKEADDYLVFVFSDANLGGYGITPAIMCEVLSQNDTVKAYAVFLSEPLAARHLQDGLPVGKGYVCLNMAELPTTFKEIFASAAAD